MRRPSTCSKPRSESRARVVGAPAQPGFGRRRGFGRLGPFGARFRGAGGAALAVPAQLRLPAGCVPVAAQVGRVDRHDDLVAHAGGDLVVATGTAVRLDRLVGLDVAHGHVVGAEIVALGPVRSAFM